MFKYYAVIYGNVCNMNNVSFQTCCYGRFEELITYPSYEAGSTFMYDPWMYPSLHYEYDLKPKQWCCLFSDNCHLYYQVRPLDRCVGYVFPWFGQ